MKTVFQSFRQLNLPSTNSVLGGCKKRFSRARLLSGCSLSRRGARIVARTLGIAAIFAIAPAAWAGALGINFNDNDVAGAQEGQNTFGANWTDLSGATGSGASINGAPAATTLSWASSNTYRGGSWTGMDGFNAAIGTMRIYLDDGGGGVSVTVNGLAAWLQQEGADTYSVTIYSSTDHNGATFPTASVGGQSVPIILGGNGTWDGTAEDPLGNDTNGARGSGSSAPMALDELAITMPPRAGSVRGTIAAIVITPTEGSPFKIASYTIDCGGGMASSANSSFSVTGTIGQFDASHPASDATFALGGGFWGSDTPSPSGYSAWAASNLTAGSDMSFDGDANQDGIPNGIAYVFGESGVEILGLGIITAPPEAVPNDVYLVLEESIDLMDWDRVLEIDAGFEVFLDPNLTISEGQITDSTSSVRQFYRYRATQIP